MAEQRCLQFVRRRSWNWFTGRAERSPEMERWFKSVLVLLVFQNIDSAILRNNALMNKMVTKFQDKENFNEIDNTDRDHPDDAKPKANVVELMQKVLCKNFPSIPCKMITKDPTLRNLIEKSVQQIKYKKMTVDKTTQPPTYPLTLFPVIDSEDLSNFLHISDSFHKQKNIKKKNRKNAMKAAVWSHEKIIKDKKPTTHTPLYSSRKKIRKFYPHKVKYKDKNNAKADFNDYSGDKLSMSVEMPEPANAGLRRKNFDYNPAAPSWRIDYTKHGEPNINVFGYETNLKGKIIKSGPSVIVDETVVEQDSRKEILHPDLYIKKSYIRKQHKNPVQSENLEY